MKARGWVTIVLLIGVACTGDPSPVAAPTHRDTVHRGGVFRSAIEDFGFSDDLDPTGESSPLGMALESQLLVRTLVTYRHMAGRAGTEPIADLATTTGTVSPDGLTWTFTLKEGVRFGPPADRPITSADVAFAFRRIEDRDLVTEDGYGDLYDGLIVGMNGPGDHVRDDIEGIQTPDSRTIVFHLTHPAGDFLHRLALPAAGPLPREIAKCFEQPGEYGRYLVSSGPYMVQGASLRGPFCFLLEPNRGFSVYHYLRLVRNPAYDSKTDDPAARESFPDRIELRINTDADDILRRIDTGALHARLDNFPLLAEFLDRYRHVASHRESLDWLDYLSLNVVVPPFDDVHVRKAANLVIDRGRVVKVFGGRDRGPAATQIFPPLIEPGSRPPSLPSHSDLSAARREMTMSRYDGDGNGRCDGEDCHIVLANPPTTPPYANLRPVVVDALAEIGIEVEIRDLDCYCPYPPHYAAANLARLAITSVRPLYPDPRALAQSLHSTGIDCEDQVNFSEVGMTGRQARRCGILMEYHDAGKVPSLDDRIDQCEALVKTNRSECWAALDAFVMRSVLPWVPLRFPTGTFLTGPTLTRYEFDQAFGTLSLAHVAVA